VAPQVDQALSWQAVESDLGLFIVGGDLEVVRRVILPHELLAPPASTTTSAVVDEAAEQLAQFLDGTRQVFNVPLSSHGTAFQEAIWGLLSEIPYGSTETYGWIADGIGRPGGARAAGQALGRNPLPLLRPCHRVVAAGGLGGYGGGEALKRSLLAREGTLF
jgi:methylated-DNA-[protein]-cysteine S-methyltransferase